MATEELAPGTVSPPVPENDRMPVHGIDHVELFVGNAAQAAYYYARLRVHRDRIPRARDRQP